MSAVVDPARGALLGLYVERPNPVERVQEGEVVGYVIIAVGVLGVLLAVFQAAYLIMARLAVSAQLRNLNDTETQQCSWPRATRVSRRRQAHRKSGACGVADFGGGAA